MFTFTPTTKAITPGKYLAEPSRNRHRVTVCCPKCEGEYRLARQYIVGRGGLLNPELHCPLHGCGWKQPAALGDWGRR